MITALTTTLLAAAILGLLLFKKGREIKLGKTIFTLGTLNTDQQVTRMFGVISDFLYTIVHPSRIKSLLSRVAAKLERLVMNIFERLSNRFSVVGDMVTGRDIPKNRGSVSFFLKNIEDSKKRVK